MRRNQNGFTVVEALLILVIAGMLGFIGWYVYHVKQSTDKNYSAAATDSTVQPSKKKSNTDTKPTDPYESWKSYTSPLEKLSFKYPATWQGKSIDASSFPGSDWFQLTSPTSSLSVSWFSTVTGVGGACDDTIMPGAATGACPYWTVIDKQKLAGADLYYVAGVETDDGSKYSPWCALQSPGGILTDKSYIGYMLFKGKNNDIVISDHDYGLQNAGFMCSTFPGNFGGIAKFSGTKAEATAFLSTPEMKQAKLILLSASY